jgi:two-component system, NarL family, sensor histidine kinase DevS
VQQQRDRDGVLQSFFDIGLRLTQNLDIDQVLLTIVERSMDLTGARYGAALTLTPGGRPEKFLHRGLTEDQVALLPHPPLGKGVLGVVLEERRPIRLENISDHPASIGFPIDHVPMSAFLGVPLQEKQDLVGALYLSKSPELEPFSDEDEQIVTALGTFAAVGISNARLFATESERARNSELLQGIASRIRRSLDTSQVLTAAVEELGRAAGVQRCFIRLASGSSDHSLGQIAFEWDAPGTEPLSSDPQDQYAVASLAAVTRMTQWSSDIEHDERLIDPSVPGTPQDLLEVGTRSALSAPLEWGDELIGVVTFHCSQTNEWSEAQVELIEGAADEVATALHHAKLYTRAVETADELARLDELRRDFVSMVSHELRSPMTVVAGIADLLQKRSDQLSEENRKDLIDTLGREARRLTKLVSEVLDVESIDQDVVRLLPVEVDLAELSRESIQDAGSSERTEVVIDPGDTVVIADRDRIKQVLLNLISNATKFSPEHTRVIVNVRPEDDSVCVSIADSGPGMTAEEISRLFQRFSRIPRTGASQPGSGLGLYVSKVLVEKHGGEIWVDSTPGKGSTFSFRLPRHRSDRSEEKGGAGL